MNFTGESRLGGFALACARARARATAQQSEFVNERIAIELLTGTIVRRLFAGAVIVS